MVGVNGQQKETLPSNIIAHERTDSIEALRKFYAIADVFVNPTYEEAFGLTNLESIACGTPVITYDTGGSPEGANIFGWTVPKGRIDMIAELIKNNYPTKIEDVPTQGDIMKTYLTLYY